MTKRDPHDSRCELTELAGYQTARPVCRCAERLEVRLASREVNNRFNVTDLLFGELYGETGPAPGADIIREVHDRMMHELYAHAASEGRLVLPFTVHLISGHSRDIDATVVKAGALTLPLGTPLTADVFTVAEDWMSSRGLRT